MAQVCSFSTCGMGRAADSYISFMVSACFSRDCLYMSRISVTHGFRGKPTSWMTMGRCQPISRLGAEVSTAYLLLLGHRFPVVQQERLQHRWVVEPHQRF